MPNYIAIIHKENNSDYGVSFPDFPGCITAGSTIDEAKDMASEALKFHVEGLIADGEELPEPGGLEEVQDKTAAAYLIVPIDIDSGKSTRINISITEKLLRIVDNEAEKRGMTRSRFIANAVRHEINNSDTTLSSE